MRLRDYIIDKIIERRLELNISQTNLAKMTGVNQPTISKMENKKHEPLLSMLDLFLRALKLKIIIVADDENNISERN